MKKRWVFIGTGTFLLVFGIAGLALLQTGVIDPPFSAKGEGRLEEPATVGLTESPGQSEQAALEEKSPPATEPQAPAPGANKPQGLAEKRPEPQQEGTQKDLRAEKADRPIPVPRVGRGERRYPLQIERDIPSPPQAGQKKGGMDGVPARPGGPPAYTAKGAAPDSQGQPVSIRFRFDPSKSRGVNVARVHMGDRIVIKVRRVGRAERQLYVGFEMSGETRSRPSPQYRQVARRQQAVISNIKDHDQLVLKGDEFFGADLSRQLESRDGAVLKLGSRLSSGRLPAGRAVRENGYYEIDMKIYSGNRWNIKPRSYL